MLINITSTLHEIIPVRDGKSTIGRESDNDIQLLDESVSRHHAHLSNMPNICEIADDGSSNGTFLNGNRIESATLRNGDELKIGDTVLRFEEISHEVHDDMGRSRDYSQLSQNSTVRVKRHPSDMRIPVPEKETKTFTASPFKLKRKDS